MDRHKAHAHVYAHTTTQIGNTRFFDMVTQHICRKNYAKQNQSASVIVVLTMKMKMMMMMMMMMMPTGMMMMMMVMMITMRRRITTTTYVHNFPEIYSIGSE